MKRAIKYILLSLTALVLALALFYVVRQVVAARQVQAALTATADMPTLDSGTTQSLTILPLFDGTAVDHQLQAGTGVAYLVKTDTATILLDTGYNPENLDPSPLQQNMAHLGITLDDIDTVVITHKHPDHTGGVSWWQQGTFSLGNTQADLGRKSIYVPEPMTYPDAEPEVIEAPKRLAPGVATIGAVPFVEPFPVSLFRGTGAEQALAVNVAGRGVVLITGCGHPSLATLVSRTEALFDAPLIGVVGGLHYGARDAASLQGEIDLLARRAPQVVALSSHDSGAAALQAFESAFGTSYVPLVVGEPITIAGAPAVDCAGSSCALPIALQ
jgi:7,8-dihydropterin-6-yl-methyl-4-(beta-D-ribofuranosyl)aminobenzene 5'-phosphate synthase